MPETQVIIVGGGIVGCAIQYSLAKRGVTDTLLLERLELTSGSTWHAGGNTTHFGQDWQLSPFYVGSTRLYEEAEAESDHSIGFHKVGSLKLAVDDEQLKQYHALEPFFAKLGVEYRVVSRAEAQELHPLMKTDDLLGAAFTPEDGHVDPSGATNAMAKTAKQRGATILRYAEVQKIEKQPSSGWRVMTDKGDFTAVHVVMAASFWSRELCAPLGLDLPIFALGHHSIPTERHPKVEAMGIEMPVIRDPGAAANMRVEGGGLMAGVYEENPLVWGADGIPKDFKQDLFPPDIERIEDGLLRLIERVPAFGEVGLKNVVHGPLSYTPDGYPLVGPAPGLEGFWLAAGFHAGIGMGGGAADYLASYMVDGRPPYEMSFVSPLRYADAPGKEDAIAGILAHYAAGYPAAEVKF